MILQETYKLENGTKIPKLGLEIGRASCRERV